MNISDKYHAKRRQEIIKVLGGKCSRCGFDDWRALQIDHINGGGIKDVKSFTSISEYYHKIIASNLSKDKKYQLLCANCNQIKRYENNELARNKQT